MQRARGEEPDAVVHLVVAVNGAVLFPALLIGGWKLWQRAAANGSGRTTARASDSISS